MKKYLFILIFLLCLSINSYNALNINKCTNEIKLDNVNSKNVIEYITENNLDENITKICSTDICMNINPINLQRDIKSFIEKNISYLKNKDEEISLNAELKGFKIDKIIINSCL
jgi:hypothetical protein